MTALEFYKFIDDNNIEYHYRDNEGRKDVIIFPYTFQMDDFYEILDSGDLDDGGIECTLMDGYLAIWVGNICSNNGIKLEEVFGTEIVNQ